MTTDTQRDYETSRKQLIDYFVNELEARSLSHFDGPNGSEMTIWQYKTHLIISQLWPNGGWECYYQSQQGQVDKMKKEVDDYFENKNVISTTVENSAGTKSRELKEINIPDLWHLGMKLKQQQQHKDSEQVLYTWQAAIEMKEHIRKESLK